MRARVRMGWPGLLRSKQATTRIGNRGNSMSGRYGMKSLLCAKNLAYLALPLFVFAPLPSGAQVVAKPPVTTPSAGGNSFSGPGAVRYQATKDVQDRRIDMFIGDWRDSMPRHAYGLLVLRDILTRGDNFAPPQPRALLQAANFLAYGRLQPCNAPTPSRLQPVHNLLVLVAGTGEIAPGGQTPGLHKDIAVFMPSDLEFSH